MPASRTEHRVVWLEDPTDHDYVRVVEHPRNIVTRAPRWTAAGRLVGYTVTVPSRVRGWARLFVIMPWDRSDDPAGTYYQGCPSEAVDPLTVAPGVAGRLTERAWGAPLDCPGPNGWAPL